MIIYIACGFSLRGSFYDGLLSRPVSQVMIVLLLILVVVVPLLFLAFLSRNARRSIPDDGRVGLWRVFFFTPAGSG